MKARRIVAVAVFFAGASALTTGPAYAEVLCSSVGSFRGAPRLVASPLRQAQGVGVATDPK